MANTKLPMFKIFLAVGRKVRLPSKQCKVLFVLTFWCISDTKLHMWLHILEDLYTLA